MRVAVQMQMTGSGRPGIEKKDDAPARNDCLIDRLRLSVALIVIPAAGAVRIFSLAVRRKSFIHSPLMMPTGWSRRCGQENTSSSCYGHLITLPLAFPVQLLVDTHSIPCMKDTKCFFPSSRYHAAYQFERMKRGESSDLLSSLGSSICNQMRTKVASKERN